MFHKTPEFDGKPWHTTIGDMIEDGTLDLSIPTRVLLWNPSRNTIHCCICSSIVGDKQAFAIYPNNNVHLGNKEAYFCIACGEKGGWSTQQFLDVCTYNQYGNWVSLQLNVWKLANPIYTRCPNIK